MLEAKVVKALADGHGAEGFAKAEAHLVFFRSDTAAVAEGGASFLQNDLAAAAFEHGVDGVAEGFEGFAGKTASAGLVARKRALIKQKHAAASAGEVVGSGTAGGAGAYDQGVESTGGGEGVRRHAVLV